MLERTPDLKRQSLSFNQSMCISGKNTHLVSFITLNSIQFGKVIVIPSALVERKTMLAVQSYYQDRQISEKGVVPSV